ncbi:MAG TPA: HD domain-containing phosphohydrolase [Myxococcota bacterium]|nr:HD domain-containing phosphohydrolase [Myxococcota bacterium]
MKTVLLAYEREQDLAAVGTLLEARGLRVQTARSGVEALEVARREAPHILISDVLLPKLDGFALCRRVHEDPLLAHVPVLLHSFRIEGAKYEAFAAEVGALRFFPRGSTLEDLMGAVEEQLQGSGTVRMPALVPELLERRESDRRRLGELERRLHELETANQQLTIAERVAREAAEAAARERDAAARADAEALGALQARLRDADARERQMSLEFAQARDAAKEAHNEQGRIAALESRLAELQASRARAQAAAIDADRAFAAQPVPTWLADMETHEIRAASDSAAALFGLARESLCGRSVAELLPAGVPSDDPAGLVEASFVQPGRPPLALELQFRSVSFDGRACWITAAREVTAERTSRTEHVQSALRAQALERSPVATCVADAEGRLVQANAAFSALLGLDAEALARSNLQQFEAVAEDEPTVSSVAVGGSRPDVRECRWRRPDGTSFDAEVSGVPLDGTPGLRVVVVRDLSEHRRALHRAGREQRCLAVLLELVQRAHSMTEAEILEQALVASGEFAGGTLGYVFLALPEAGHLELAAARGGDAAAATDLALMRRWRGEPPAQTALAECLAAQQVVVRDAVEGTDGLRQAGLPGVLRRQLCTPLLDGGRVAGILLLADKAEPYDEDDRRHAAWIAEGLVRVLRRRRSDAEVLSAMDHMERVMLGVVESLGGLAEAQDAGRTGRAHRVGELSAGIGTALGLPGHSVRGLRVMGQLIDAGMLHLPREILWRPGQLTAAEYELVKTHAERGYELLRAIDFPWPVAEVVRQHHERLDGSGYPRGLEGDAILLEARIIAVADAAEAMLAPRPQRPALSVGACIEELQSQAGRRYDARVVKACVKLLRERETRTDSEATVGQRIA